MKTILFLMLTSFAIGGNQATANSCNTLDSVVEKSISHVALEEKSENEEIVVVELRINEAGEAEIVQMNASQENYADYVRAELSQIEIDPSTVDPGKSFFYKFRFQYL